MASVEIDGVHLLTDPLLRAHVGPLRWYGPPPPQSLAYRADAVLISHLHRDHLDLSSLARIGPRTSIVVPRGAGDTVAAVARGPVIEVSAGDEVSIGDVSVRAVPADHPDGRDRRRNSPRASPLGYLINGSTRVYFAGDTGLFDGMSEFALDIDLALIPVGGWGLTLGEGHLNPRTAVDALRLLQPRAVIAIHWGTLRIPVLWRARSRRFTESGKLLARHARTLDDVRVIVAAPGTRIPLRRD